MNRVFDDEKFRKCFYKIYSICLHDGSVRFILLPRIICDLRFASFSLDCVLSRIFSSFFTFIFETKNGNEQVQKNF